MSGTSAGTISQNITALTLGKTYRLSFMMAGNPEAEPITKSMQVSIGDSSQTFVFDGTGFTSDNMGWTQHTMDFTATSSSMALSFTSLQDGWSGPALDDVTVAVVPEPATFALVGLGCIAMAASRRARCCA
jgi:hypothetical protein